MHWATPSAKSARKVACDSGVRRQKTFYGIDAAESMDGTDNSLSIAVENCIKWKDFASSETERITHEQEALPNQIRDGAGCMAGGADGPYGEASCRHDLAVTKCYQGLCWVPPPRKARHIFMLPYENLRIRVEPQAAGMVPMAMGQEYGGDISRIQTQRFEAEGHPCRSPASIDADDAVRPVQDIQVHEAVPNRQEPVADRSRVEEAGKE